MEDNKINANNVTGLSNVRLKNNSDVEINLGELFQAIWQARYMILIVSVFFGMSSFIYAFNQPNIYKSEALLVPAEQQGNSGLASLAGQFSGIAGLAGINMGSGGSNKTQMAIEVLRSRQFLGNFIQSHDILPELIAANSWDIQSNELSFDEKLFNKEKNEWIRKVQFPYKPQPSMQEAIKAFTKIMSVGTDKETGIVSLSVQHVSPYIAQQWVNWLVEDINSTMRDRDVAEAQKSTAFLNEQLSQTEIADIRGVLYKLIEEQMKTIMFAKVRDEYVFKTLDAPLVPEEKFGPRRGVIIVLGAIFGCMLGVLLILSRHIYREKVKLK